jgi:hypothetical protein
MTRTWTCSCCCRLAVFPAPSAYAFALCIPLWPPNLQVSPPSRLHAVQLARSQLHIFSLVLPSSLETLSPEIIFPWTSFSWKNFPRTRKVAPGKVAPGKVSPEKGSARKFRHILSSGQNGAAGSRNSIIKNVCRIGTYKV